MRTLTTAIQNALASTVRTPVISAQLFDPIEHYSVYQTLGIAERGSAACVANDGSIVRAYVDRPAGAFVATLSVQRITDPSQGHSSLPGACCPAPTCCVTPASA